MISREWLNITWNIQTELARVKFDTVNGVVDGAELVDGIFDNDELGAPDGV